MVYLISIILAFVPSLIWLALFMREDVHPEPSKTILKVFVAGMLITIPTIALEMFASCLIQGLSCPASAALNDAVAIVSIPLKALTPTANELLFIFLGVAFIEEIMKYAAVRFTILKKKTFNEPIDAVLYLIISALGFAAVENALVVSSVGIQSASLLGSGGAVEVLGARALSAVLLHILASGIIGFGLALSFFSKRPHYIFLGLSILVATFIHGMYDVFVGGLAWGDKIDETIASTVLLLVVTGIVLMAMIQYLRRLSIKTRWVNTGGDVAREVKPRKTR